MRTGFKIAIWASLGFLVSAGWGFYFATADKSIPVGPIVDALTRLTEPVAAVVIYFNSDSLLGLRAIAIVNAVTYAFLGLMVETIRRRSRILQISN